MHKLSAVQAVEKLNTKELSLQHIVTSLNERIDHLDPKLNAFLYRCAPENITNNESSCLAGLPISFKDQYHIEDLPCSFGMPKAKVSSSTADLVKLLQDKGANILGKNQFTAVSYGFSN